MTITQFVNGLTCLTPLTVKATSHFPFSVAPASLLLPSIGSLVVVTGPIVDVVGPKVIAKFDDNSTFY